MKRIVKALQYILYFIVMAVLDWIPSGFVKYREMFKMAFDGKFLIGTGCHKRIEEDQTEEELFELLLERMYHKVYREIPFIPASMCLGKHILSREYIEYDDEDESGYTDYYALNMVCRNWFKPFYILLIIIGVPIYGICSFIVVTFIVIFCDTFYAISNYLSEKERQMFRKRK